MSKVVFLIGGVGNNYFQCVYANKIDACVSGVFKSKLICRLLGWSYHENSGFELNAKNCVFFHFHFFLLLIDLLFAKVFKISFFSTIDLRGVKSKAIIFNLCNIGYFQNSCIDIPVRNILKAPYLRREGTSKKAVVHVRGGDLRNSFVGLEYYKKCISHYESIFFVSDDVDFLVNQFGSEVVFNDNSTVIDDAVVLFNSRHMVSSSSTFALMLAIESLDVKEIIVFPMALKSVFTERFLLEFSDKIFFK